jgi:PAS domain S-box-containing protein
MLEQELAQLLEGTTDAAFVADFQGEIRTWNKAAEKLFGYEPSYVIGKPCAEIVGGKISTGVPVCYEYCDILECVRTGKEVSNYDMEIKTSSGAGVWVNVSLLVTFHDRTDRRFFVHFMRDISARKKAEKLTNKMLKIAKELVSQTGESKAMPPISPLTPQEKNILRLLSIGKTTKEIATELHISGQTLRNHFSHINHKLHTRSRVQAMVQALKRGLI